MILETAVLNVRPGQEGAFEAAMREARPLIVTSPGCLGMEVRRCLEVPNRYLLLVQWRAREDHTIGFRQSDAYQAWRGLLHRYYDPMPQVEHYAPPLDLAQPT
jgi:heme-degrading monooxygenase HmoA